MQKLGMHFAVLLHSNSQCRKLQRLCPSPIIVSHLVTLVFPSLFNNLAAEGGCCQIWEQCLRKGPKGCFTRGCEEEQGSCQRALWG